MDVFEYRYNFWGCSIITDVTGPGHLAANIGYDYAVRSPITLCVPMEVVE